VTAGFVVFRAAVFDGRHSVPWSPLVRDDAGFGSHLKRRARREALSVGRRTSDFLKEEMLVLGGFAGGIALTSM